MKLPHLCFIFNIVKFIHHIAKDPRLPIRQGITADHVLKIYILNGLKKYNKVTLSNPWLMIILCIETQNLPESVQLVIETFIFNWRGRSVAELHKYFYHLKEV
jgi:hypothetical protein